jgi:predicted dehydrogenase
MDGPEAATRLFGTKGYGSLFPTELKFKLADLAGKYIPELPGRTEHCDQVIYDRQMAHFVESVRSRKNPSPGIEEGVTVLKILEAAYESARFNNIVTLT